MRVIRDFKCPVCGVFERFIDHTTETVDCECGSVANRQFSAPTIGLDGTDPSFPGAYDKWARIREDNARIKAKRSYAGE